VTAAGRLPANDRIFFRETADCAVTDRHRPSGRADLLNKVKALAAGGLDQTLVRLPVPMR
jgi:hypothetical protein